MNNLHKHLDYIQNTITRMASNSFYIKGWTITLVSGILVLASKTSGWWYYLFPSCPILFFWALDSYYLYLERKFKDLYDYVRTKKEDKIDFSMKINNSILSHKTKYLKCLISPSTMFFYLPLLVVTIVIVILSIRNNIPLPTTKA